MRGLHFETAPKVAPSAPNRTDIPCFVGFVDLRKPGYIPSELSEWLRKEGWIDGPDALPSAHTDALQQVPLPIDNWEMFDALFSWEKRPAASCLLSGETARYLHTYLGAAVRGFFAQGGRRCYVIRTGDGFAFDLDREVVRSRLADLIPSPGDKALSPYDRPSWRGLTLLHGLPDVSFVVFPDLPDLVASTPTSPEPEPYVEGPAETFVLCSDSTALSDEGEARCLVPAPSCLEESGYRAWLDALGDAALFLSRYRRDVQLVASIPLPGSDLAASEDLLNALLGWRALYRLEQGGVASAFVQLTYPWVAWDGATHLPGGYAPPDGLLTGLLARNALMRGGFRSAAGTPVFWARDTLPRLSTYQREHRHPVSVLGDDPVYSLEERVSLFGMTPDGMCLLSDVTLSGDEAYRPAGVNRLMSLLVREARRLGEALVFEASNELLWARLKANMEKTLERLRQLGALRGATKDDAYTVRCDRSTMTQNDIDAGRVIASVSFQAALPIERITVYLALDEGGQVSLADIRGAGDG